MTTVMPVLLEKEAAGGMSAGRRISHVAAEAAG
jgi:hypothetical protein